MEKYKRSEEDLEKDASKYADEHQSLEHPLLWQLINTFKKGYRTAENNLEYIVKEKSILIDILARLITKEQLDKIIKTYFDSMEADKIIAEIGEKINKPNRTKSKYEMIISRATRIRNELTELRKAELSNKLDSIQEFKPIQLNNLKNPE